MSDAGDIDMREWVDLERYPIERADSAPYGELVEGCRAQLREHGSFNLDGFLRDSAVDRAVRELEPRMAGGGFRHARRHNIYFEDDLPGLPGGHPALVKTETVNHTLCADQLRGTLVERLYEWAPLIAFLARTMDKPCLYEMNDPLGRVNVLAYGQGEALNWHFDRSQFTTTLVIRTAEAGGEFEFRSGLRSDTDPNYDGVARLLRGEDPLVRVQSLAAGTLNVFAGRCTAHRITPVRGTRSRMVAVFSYYETPGVAFQAAERLGFYGRAG
jgi:hypothetical protein